MSKVSHGKLHIVVNQAFNQTYVASTPLTLTASQLIKTFTQENQKMVVASHVKIYISATNTFLMEIPSFFNLRKWPLTYNRSCQVFCHSGDKSFAKFYRQSLKGLLTAIRSVKILILVHCRVNFGQS